MKATTIHINAKCSDLCFASLTDKDGNPVGKDHDGYVPQWMPGEHCGDYVELDIDIATGRITNWKKPTDGALIETFGTVTNND